MLQAEALAVLEGLSLCVARGLCGVLVEVDSAVLVSLVKSSALGGWSYCNVLRKIRRLLGQVSGSFQHVFREANMVADKMAALQRFLNTVFDSISLLPWDIRGCLALDTREFPSVRQVYY